MEHTSLIGGRLLHSVTIRRLLGALALAPLLGCPSGQSDAAAEYQNVMKFDTARVRLVSGRDTFNLRVELALTPVQQQMGLMERTALAEHAGMLFVYDSTQAADAGFWMYRTRIPLDIAFFDSSGVFRAVRAMEPCATEVVQGCPTYAPGVPYRTALEMNAGYFAKHDIGIGDSLLLRDLPDSLRR